MLLELDAYWELLDMAAVHVPAIVYIVSIHVVTCSMQGTLCLLADQSTCPHNNQDQEPRHRAMAGRLAGDDLNRPASCLIWFCHAVLLFKKFQAPQASEVSRGVSRACATFLQDRRSLVCTVPGP